jgi:hypothetical protein
MNVEIGAEAALFPEKEYINGTSLAVWRGTGYSIGLHSLMKTRFTLTTCQLNIICSCCFPLCQCFSSEVWI